MVAGQFKVFCRGRSSRRKRFSTTKDTKVTKYAKKMFRTLGDLGVLSGKISNEQAHEVHQDIALRRLVNRVSLVVK